MFNSKYNFDKLLNSGVKYGLLIPYLQAYVSRSLNPVLAVESLELMERVLEEYLQPEQENFFAIESKFCRGKTQFFSKESFRKIRYAVIYVETLLQATAILSKNQRNEEALKKAEKAFRACKALIRGLLAMFELIIKVGPDNLKFASGIELGYDWYLTHLTFLNEIMLDKLGFGGAAWTVEAHTWRENKENLLKDVFSRIKQMNGNEKSNVRKVTKDWMRMFSICNVVGLAEFEVFEKKIDSLDIDDNLFLKFFLTFSCNIFSIATENRFLSMEQLKQSKRSSEPQVSLRFLKKEGSNHVSAWEDVLKDVTLQRDPRYINSERIHLRAIQVVLFSFDENM